MEDFTGGVTETFVTSKLPPNFFKVCLFITGGVTETFVTNKLPPNFFKVCSFVLGLIMVFYRGEITSLEMSAPIKTLLYFSHSFAKSFTS